MSDCPCCGEASLLAVCDVLVLKALETMGKYIVRVERSRYNVLGNRPKHLAHTIWQPTDDVVDKALKGAWDVVPALLVNHSCCDVASFDVVNMLNDYVHDLVITGIPHSLSELDYRFRYRLGVVVR